LGSFPFCIPYSRKMCMPSLSLSSLRSLRLNLGFHLPSSADLRPWQGRRAAPSATRLAAQRLSSEVVRCQFRA
jgi:hypothetical protein